MTNELFQKMINEASDKELVDDGRIGTTYVELAKGIFRNTGRHIDIDSFLKQIGGNGNER